MIDWIRNQAVNAELVLSVCTGALLLAKAGLLDGIRLTKGLGLRPTGHLQGKSFSVLEANSRLSAVTRVRL